MPKESSSSYQRHWLRAQLRELREKANLTQEQTAAEMEWSTSKVIRIESGAVKISVTDLRGILTLYKVTDSLMIEELVAAARAARQRSWITPYKDRLNDAFVSFIELEPHASVVRHFQDSIVPGLLQTPEYARVCLAGAYSMFRAIQTEGTALQETDIGLEIRRRRQAEFFGQAAPPQLLLVLDESVLRREVGGRPTLIAQLRHLVDLGSRENVHIHVIPFSHGYQPWFFGAFVTLEFDDPRTKPLFFRENGGATMISNERTETVEEFQRVFDFLVKRALDEQASRTFIEQVIDELVDA